MDEEVTYLWFSQADKGDTLDIDWKWLEGEASPGPTGYYLAIHSLEELKKLVRGHWGLEIHPYVTKDKDGNRIERHNILKVVI